MDRGQERQSVVSPGQQYSMIQNRLRHASHHSHKHFKNVDDTYSCFDYSDEV